MVIQLRRMEKLNFAGLPEKFSNYKNAKFVIIPISYERTTTYMEGTKNAPLAILDASKNFELYDEELNRVIAKSGIATLETLFLSEKSSEEMIKIVKETCLKVIKDDKFPVVIGGEHSITIGTVLGLKERYSNFSVLQLDAHADLRNSYNGSIYNHACVMRRIREFTNAVQIGIRSLSEEEMELIKKENFSIFFAHEMRKKFIMKEILRKIKEEKVFITIDADFFDPSLIPSVGTPEPGGFGWYETLNLLKGIINEKRVIGFDVVEFCPNKENKTPDFIIAKFIYKLIGYISQKLE